MQAKGRLQPWNSKGWRPEGLVEAAARDLEGFKSFKCLKPGKRMPRRRVLRVWRLASGRFERPNNRGYVHQTAGCNAGTAGLGAMAVTKQVPHLRWSQAPPLPWRRPGSADIAVFRLNPVSCWFLDIFHYCMYPSYSQGFPVQLPSQGAELFPSAAKISLPGHHPAELVAPRREFFGPRGGNQRQGGHWCGYMWISCPHFIHHILHHRS